MRHPHHLPPNVAPTLGVLLPPDPPDSPPAPVDAREQSASASQPRTCEQLGVCQGDARCEWCAPVPPIGSVLSASESRAKQAAPEAAEQRDTPKRMEQFGFAIVVAALAGISTGLMIVLWRLALEWMRS